jgi:hypothetical protein
MGVILGVYVAIFGLLGVAGFVSVDETVPRFPGADVGPG